MRIFLLICIIINEVYAAPVKTNKNEISGEFNVISNRAELDGNVEASRTQATSNIGSGAMSEVFSPNEGVVTDLKGIDEHSLESKGREAKDAPDNDYFRENFFETDYSRPGAMAHKKDADEIVNATEVKLRKLTEILRENGIDCEPLDDKTKAIEDPYYIDIETTRHKEVEYDPHFCEYPRHTYNCHDNMTIHCEKRNWKFYEWSHETRWMNIPGGEAYGNGWLYSIYWKKNRFGMHMRGDGATKHGLKHSIGRRINKYHEQIEVIHISPRGEGGLREGRKKEFLWDSYKVGYKYREAEEICDQWSKEKWDERCSQRQ
jgi:hypothetical protein